MIGDRQIDIGSLVSIVWTEGCETPPVIGVVTKVAGALTVFDGKGGTERQKIELFSNGKRSWFERGDLRVVA